MKTAVYLIILSHLSDVQMESFIPEKMSMIQDRLSFVKYLTNKYKDTTVEIDAEAEFKQHIDEVNAEVAQFWNKSQK